MNGALLTPATISRLPLGLLDFLGIKSGGTYPRDLSTTLASTWDMLDLLAANHHSDIRNDTPVNAPNLITPIPLVVPQTEVWYVPFFTVSATTIAAEAINGTVGVVGQGIPQPAFILGDSAGVGASITMNASTKYPIWMGPGDQPAFRVNSITTAGNITLQFNLRRMILRI
jgi:hypothetical protein